MQLQLFHSKSTALVDNEAGHDGLGGRISADPVISVTPRPLMLSGVTVFDVSAYGGVGTGKLVWTPGVNTLAYQAPRDKVLGTPVVTPVNGAYEIPSASPDAFISVIVVFADLPVVATTVKVSVDPVIDAIFDGTNAGNEDYRCVFAKNTGVVPVTNIYPLFRTLTAKTQQFYPRSGSASLVLDSTDKFEDSGFVRNRRTGEIMYYTQKGGSDGKSLVVPYSCRGIRGTSPVQGAECDEIEQAASIDIFMEMYNPLVGAARIANDTLPPVNANFEYPPTLEAPSYSQLFSLLPNEILTIWMRRTLPVGALSFTNFPLEMDIKFTA